MRVKMIEFVDIPDKTNPKNLIRCVRVADIEPAPENVEMYPPNWPEHLDPLGVLLDEEEERTGVPNREEIEVDQETGTAVGGCSRTIIAKKKEYTHLRAKPSSSGYNTMTKLQRMKYIKEMNIM
jgi:hypothetical protein